MRIWKIIPVIVLAAVVAGCSAGAAAPADEGGAVAYASESLDGSYEGALDVQGQLAMGTLLLEETEHVLTSEQATTLLPLWRAIQSGTLQSDTETYAVLGQVEGMMTSEQLSAIAEMRLTQDDLQTWMLEQGLGMGSAPGAGAVDSGAPSDRSGGPPAGFSADGEMPPEVATRMAERATVTEEELAAMREQAGGLAGGPGARGGAFVILNPLIELLSQRAEMAQAGQAQVARAGWTEAEPLPEGDETPAPAAAPADASREATPAATAADASEDPTPTAEESSVSGVAALADEGSQSGAEGVVTTSAVAQGDSEVAIIADASVADSSQEPASTQQAVPAAEVLAGSAGSTEGPVRIEDPSPGPPFTMEVTSVRLVGDVYEVIGTVRNDSSETYEGIGVFATFYTVGPAEDPNERGFRGRPGDPEPDPVDEGEEDGGGSGGDMLYPHGPVDAVCSCTVLEPGQECYFRLEIYARDYVGYGLHAEGQPIAFFQRHEQADVVLSGVRAANDGVGNVRITGTLQNENSFAVESATVSGTLLDANGQVVSLGSTTVLGPTEPGASASFDLRITYQPYTSYQVTVQAARD